MACSRHDQKDTTAESYPQFSPRSTLNPLPYSFGESVSSSRTPRSAKRGEKSPVRVYGGDACDAVGRLALEEHLSDLAVMELVQSSHRS
jgi:hypothetical protein